MAGASGSETYLWFIIKVVLDTQAGKSVEVQWCDVV
jgi:hypothetical protein